MSCDVNIQGGVDVINSPNVQFLTAASGNYTVPAGKSILSIAMVGGGPGGGGVANAAASGASGQPGVALTAMLPVTPGQVIAFTCGANGTGGAAGNNAGMIGGDTTFGPFTAKGGNPGSGSASGNATGPSGATLASLMSASRTTPAATGFIVTLLASGGGNGAAGVGGSSLGNTSPWGNPGASGGPNSAGGNATGFGMPGGGASSSTGGAFAGGDGTPGAIAIIAE